jgi:hypothetical protein
MKNAWTALAAGVLVSLNGCGTIMNLASRDPVVPFGGVQKDVEVLQPSRPLTQSGDAGQGPVVIIAFAAAELCLSAVGDVLTLPVALWICNARDARDGTCSRTSGPDEPARIQDREASAGEATEHFRSDSR